MTLLSSNSHGPSPREKWRSHRGFERFRSHGETDSVGHSLRHVVLYEFLHLLEDISYETNFHRFLSGPCRLGRNGPAAASANPYFLEQHDLGVTSITSPTGIWATFPEPALPTRFSSITAVWPSPTPRTLFGPNPFNSLVDDYGIYIGNTGSGALQQSGGTITTNHGLLLGTAAGSYGYYGTLRRLDQRIEYHARPEVLPG